MVTTKRPSGRAGGASRAGPGGIPPPGRCFMISTTVTVAAGELGPFWACRASWDRDPPGLDFGAPSQF
eukprot:15466653-Alexandrium_andersonii.AAC.1